MTEEKKTEEKTEEPSTGVDVNTHVTEVAPQGEVEKNGADKVAEEAGLKAQDEYIAAVEKVGKIARENNIATFNDSQTTAGAEAYVEEAHKQVEKEVKVTDDGRIVGVDGVNPVSNENPDPRTVQGVRL